MASSKKSKEDDYQKKHNNKKTTTKKESKISKPVNNTSKSKTRTTTTTTTKCNSESISRNGADGHEVSFSLGEGENEIIMIDGDSSCGSREIEERDEKMCEIIAAEFVGSSTDKNSKNKRKLIDDDEEEDKICVFPMARVKRIIKSQGIDSSLTQDVVFLINKASEMFVEQFSEDAHTCSIQDRKKSLHYNHLSSVVAEQKRYDFLSEFVPEKVKAEDALAEWKSTESRSE